jgi:DNA invertase Pin-like site-specific DNA recombinase
VIYCRISEDAADEKKGVTRQAHLCRGLAEAREFTLVRKKEYVDNDVSAWSGAERTAWNEVLELAANGKIDGIVTYNIDRIVRRVKDLSLLLDVITQHQLRIYTVASGELDLSTPGGIMVAQILASVAEHESSIKSTRVVSAKQDAAKRGLPSGGPRPFGFKDDRITHDPGEAEALKDAVQKFLDDPDHVLSKAVDVIRGHGYEMNSRRLRTMLITGRIAGRRDYVPMEKRRKRTDGKSATYLYDAGVNSPAAVWDAIIEEDQWLACRGILLGRERTGTRERRSKSLLAGVIVCGECGGYMAVGRDRYQCQSHHGAAGGGKGCGGTTIHTDVVESTVRDLCKVRLNDTEGLSVLVDRTPDAARRRELMDQRSNLNAAQNALLRVFAGTAVDLGPTGPLEEEVALIQRRIEEVEDELAELAQAEVVSATLDLRADLLDTGDQETQRRIIGALIQEVLIYSVGRGNSRDRQPFPRSWDVWWKGGTRPTRAGKPTTSVRMETARRKATRPSSRTKGPQL